MNKQHSREGYTKRKVADCHLYCNDGTLQSDYYIVSGDYSAATDNIKLESVQIVGEVLIEKLEEEI